jgi:hypothetical protein
LHAKAICDVIKEQYELKDGLKWRLGLRNPEFVNIARLGLKAINLSKNNLSNVFVEILCRGLLLDNYIKSIALAHNNVGVDGIKELQAVSLVHPRLLSVHLNGNRGSKQCQHELEVMKYAFLKNIKAAINMYHKDGSRIKLEWIHPWAIGLIDNTLHD